MRTPRFTLGALAALALALPLAGCPSMGGPGTSRELQTSQFDDVSAPRGFALDLAEGRSFSYSEGGSGPGAIHMGRLEYTGQGTTDDILAWYAAEMHRPIHGWDAGAPVQGARPGMLFKRGQERCLVSVREEGAAVRIIVERNTGGALPQ